MSNQLKSRNGRGVGKKEKRVEGRIKWGRKGTG